MSLRKRIALLGAALLAVLVPVGQAFGQAEENGSATSAISAASLPLPAGASTSAKQPALGTAGTASADVLSCQGVAGMTPLVSKLVDTAGTNVATVKAASTAAVATDTALVCAISPNNAVTVNAAAGTTGTGTETYTLNTAATLVPASALSGRKGITICNLHANSIFCAPSSTPPAVNKGVPLVTNACITFDFTDAVPMKCISATADQASSPATYSVEFK